MSHYSIPCLIIISTFNYFAQRQGKVVIAKI